MKGILSVSLIILLLLSACTHTGTLYPANKQAQNIGQLTLTSRLGNAQLAMPDGEIISGQCRTVDNSVYGSGSSSSFATGNTVSTGNATMYGAGGLANMNFNGSSNSTANAYAHSSNQITPGSSNGMCAMSGNKGTSGSCNYFVNQHGLLRSGAGTCSFSNGALYNLMF